MGEFVVILGASGTGKSTILNILGGMDTAASGQVFVGDQEITRFNEKKLTAYRGEKVGFVFQYYNLIPNLNALENVEFATEVCKNHLDARDILHKVGLKKRIKNFPSQLSGGEQQRVAIARAVSKNPFLLLQYKASLKIHSIPVKNEINTPTVIEGSIPSKKGEILLDSHYAKEHNFHIGDEISLSADGNEIKFSISGLSENVEYAKKNETQDHKAYGAAYIAEETIPEIADGFYYNEVS